MQVSVLGFPTKGLGEIHSQINITRRKVASTKRFIDYTRKVGERAGPETAAAPGLCLHGLWIIGRAVSYRGFQTSKGLLPDGKGSFWSYEVLARTDMAIFPIGGGNHSVNIC